MIKTVAIMPLILGASLLTAIGVISIPLMLQQTTGLAGNTGFMVNMLPFQQVTGDQMTVVRKRRQSSSAKKNNKQKGFEIECLAAHNKWRRLHQVDDLVFDKKIAAFSQKRADFIAASDGAEFKHPNDLIYGENLAWHSVGTQSCNDLIKMWYDELDLYDFSKAEFSHETGHFTQLVWKDTKRVGCAKALSSGPRGGVYLVCNYDPPGNFLGEAPANVLRLKRPQAIFKIPTPVLAPIKPIIPSTSTSTATSTTSPRISPTTTSTSYSSTTRSTTAVATSGIPSVELATSASATKPPNEQKKKESEKEKEKRKKKGNNKKKNKKDKKKRNKKKNKNKKTATSTTTTTTTSTTLKPAVG